jgi:uncharacterized membrane protein
LKSNKNYDLLLICLATAVLFIIVALCQSTPARLILGVPFVVFSPGYTLIAALFPGRGSISSAERIAYSIASSLALVIVIGLILNYAWEITIYPILISLTAVIYLLSAIAWYRRSRVEDVPVVKDENNQPERRPLFDVVLYIALVLVCIASIGVVVYKSLEVKESYTEFYILGAEGNAADYPQELALGEEGSVTIGIINHEGEPMTYRIEVTIDGIKCSEITAIDMAPDETWEEEVGFAPDIAGDNQKVEFLLYQGGGTEPYLEPLYLWIDVTN